MRKLRLLFFGGLFQIIIGSIVIALVGGMTSKILGKNDIDSNDNSDIQ